MAKSQRRSVVANAGMEVLKELFGDDVEARIKKKEVEPQTCIVSGCKRTFWIPYGRYYQDGGNINRGVCGPECDAAYQLGRQQEVQKAEEALFKRFGIMPVPTLLLVA